MSFHSPTFRSKASSLKAGGSTTFAINMPSGIVAGDMLVLAVVAYKNTDTFTMTGWTLRQSNTSIGGATQYKLYVYTRVATGSEGSTMNLTSNGSNIFGVAICAAYEFCSAYDTVGSVQEASSGTAFTAPAISAAEAGETLIFIGGDTRSSTKTFTPPSGMTERDDIGTSTEGAGLELADVALVGSGTTGTKSATRSSALSGEWGSSVMLALKGAYSAPVVTTGEETDITGKYVTLNGNVNGDGADATYKWQIGTAPGVYTIDTDTAVVSGGAGATDVSIRAGFDLDFETVYYARLTATSSGGTTNGSEITFTTGSRPPTHYGSISGVLA